MFDVIAYKNQIIYRKWKFFNLLEETEKYYILQSNNTVLMDVNKNQERKIKDKMIWFLFKKKWFNIICYINSNKIEYYCNISSPIKCQNNNFSYIDYDLDLIINDSISKYKILDLKEFNRNRFKYKYTKEIIDNSWNAVTEIKKEIKNKTFFNIVEIITEIQKKQS